VAIRLNEPKMPRGTIEPVTKHANSFHRRHFRTAGTQPLSKTRLPASCAISAINLIIANGENSAAGFGITPALAEELFELNIDVITTGNHVWDKREIVDYFQMVEATATGRHADSCVPRIIRGHARMGLVSGQKAKIPYAVINLQGRVFMASNDDPFRTADQLLQKDRRPKIIVVDFHAEATSEKISLGWYLDGRVTAVIGTHTHVPTADERCSAQGHCLRHRCRHDRPYDGVIGVKKELVVGKFLNGMPVRFEPATGDVRLCAVIIDCDDKTGKARDRTADAELIRLN
jgi:2',3'-cyclic-nucleotide 2'-phosphodiesterase